MWLTRNRPGINCIAAYAIVHIRGALRRLSRRGDVGFKHSNFHAKACSFSTPTNRHRSKIAGFSSLVLGFGLYPLRLPKPSPSPHQALVPFRQQGRALRLGASADDLGSDMGAVATDPLILLIRVQRMGPRGLALERVAKARMVGSALRAVPCPNTSRKVSLGT